MKKKASSIVFAVIVGLLALAPAPSPANPAGGVKEQLEYAREQLIAAGLQEVSRESGVISFEGKVPRPVTVIVEPKTPGSSSGSLVLKVIHPRAEGQKTVRESTLKFDTFAEMKERLKTLKTVLSEPAKPVAAAGVKCPFARFAAMFFPGVPKNHKLLQSTKPRLKAVTGVE